MNSYFNELVSEVDIYPNPDLKWERTNSLNGGIEFSILNHRVMISSDVYYKKTNDAFMEKNISRVNGLAAYTINSGKIINKGYNVSLTLSPFTPTIFAGCSPPLSPSHTTESNLAHPRMNTI
mgnify:CR=1 FL=1